MRGHHNVCCKLQVYGRVHFHRRPHAAAGCAPPAIGNGAHEIARDCTGKTITVQAIALKQRVIRQSAKRQANKITFDNDVCLGGVFRFL